MIYAGTVPRRRLPQRGRRRHLARLANAVQPDKLKMSFACRVMRIGIEPGQPDQIHAALEVGGTMRSLDGGETWSDGSADLVQLAADNANLKSMIQSDSEAEGMLDAHALAVSSAAPGNVFLAVRMGLFRSDDRGKSWRDMEIGRFSPLTYGRDIRVSPHDPRTLYAALSPAARSKDGSLYRSTDLGAHVVAPRPRRQGRRHDDGAGAAPARPRTRSTASRAAPRCSAPRTAARRGASRGCPKACRTSTRWRARSDRHEFRAAAAPGRDRLAGPASRRPGVRVLECTVFLQPARRAGRLSRRVGPREVGGGAHPGRRLRRPARRSYPTARPSCAS